MIAETSTSSVSGAKVGLAFSGDPLDPRSWSGIPAGIASGLRECGATPVPLDAAPPAAVVYPAVIAGWSLRRDRMSAGNTALVHALHSCQVRRRLRAAPALDGIVQLGTEFTLPATERFACLLDMTVAQADQVHPYFARMSQATRDGWIGRQRRIFHAARACCVASGWAGDSLLRDYGVPPERIHVVGFGANHVTSPAERDWGAPRYLFVGREWERKNGPKVLDAFRRVHRELPAAALDVVGDHPPIDDSGVTGHGELSLERGAGRARLNELFNRATCFVMPSRCEPFGIAYVEAGMAGIPSIGTTVGGAGDVIADGSGRLVDPGDEDALVRAMIELADPDRAAKAAAAARRRSGEFTWQKVAERLLRALSPE